MTPQDQLLCEIVAAVAPFSHLEYLDDLRESGETNMYGAYLMGDFRELDEKQAGKILSYWMQTFAERHNLKDS